MTTLLLTGAGGFLGSHILQAALRRTDWDIVCIDSFRHNGGTDRILQAMVDVPATGEILDDTRKRVRLMVHDLAAPFSHQQTLDLLLPLLRRPTYIVHAAARCSVDDSIQDPRGHVTDNVQSTLTMLELARMATSLTRYLHISTDEVFGPDGLAGITHNPSSPYAASKAACEDLTQAYARTYGVPASIANSANLFGERQSQLAFIPKVIKAVLAGDTIPIHSKAGRPAWRWYTYAPNVATWTIDHLAGDFAPDRNLLTGQLGINVLLLAERIASIMERPLKYEIVHAEDVRPGADHAYGKMPVMENWKPEVDAAEGLEQTVRWFVENPAWLA